MSETTPGETPVERRLREMAQWSGFTTDRQVIDAAREAIALLRVFQAGPGGEAWHEWLANVAALVARCEEDR